MTTKNVFFRKQGQNNILPSGFITKSNGENESEELIYLSVLTGKENKVAPILAGTEFQITQRDDKYGTTIGKVVGGDRLSLFHKKDSDYIHGASIEYYQDVMFMDRVILISNDIADDDVESFIFDKLRDIIAVKLPIPMESEWEIDFIKSIRDFVCVPLNIYGGLNLQSAYYVDVDLHKVGEALSVSYGKQEFLKVHNRAPMIRSLWSMIDPARFSVKTWSKFVSLFGGKESFEKLSYSHQLIYIYFYECFQDKASDVFEIYTKSQMDLISTSWKESAVKVKKGTPFPSDLLLKAINILVEHADNTTRPLYVGSLLSTYDELNLPELVKSPSKLIDELLAVKYTNVNPFCKHLAVAANNVLLSDNQFQTYQNKYLAVFDDLMNSPRKYPTVKGESGKYQWEAVDMTNPEAWFAGISTNCCQHLHSCGGVCVEYAAENPSTSGIFLVKKKGKIIAQSWFWIKDGWIVFDNIEVLGGEVRDSILDCYKDYLIKGIEPRNGVFKIKHAGVGLGYNDMPILNTFDKVKNPVHVNCSYNDSNSQVRLYNFKVEEKEKNESK